ncbi:hypothetical protein CGCA056_v005138 [Colletotrichum aenigma]|uniref:uncharacterized protein n=1 Tax=Colletotrichum aenigma TaxID=1215731 RepID=UPI00187274B3|nr:uncharacterized protein CGCA056_v005138 [Colletotrichum aenigma]KAF5524443.1 hypothetical protein CGCA056_v005138 [Colletotrichum aenigma]
MPNRHLSHKHSYTLSSQYMRRSRKHLSIRKQGESIAISYILSALVVATATSPALVSAAVPVRTAVSPPPPPLRLMLLDNDNLLLLICHDPGRRRSPARSTLHHRRICVNNDRSAPEDEEEPDDGAKRDANHGAGAER